MKRFSTFITRELELQILSACHDIKESMRCATLQHVHTIANNNHYHFEHCLDSANKAIAHLVAICPSLDIELLSKEQLLKEAEEFLSSDL